MARRRTAVSRTVRTRVVRPQIVRVPARTSRRVARGARRGMTKAAKAAMSEKHTIVAIAAAGALGFAKRQRVDLPKIDSLGTPGTYGVAAWLLSRFTDSPTVAHAATGLLSVAAFEMASGDELTGDEEY